VGKRMTNRVSLCIQVDLKLDILLHGPLECWITNMCHHAQHKFLTVLIQITVFDSALFIKLQRF
jgi:hypothetical protein